MTDDQAAMVRQAVEQYLRSSQGQEFDIGSDRFDQLVNYVRQYVGASGPDRPPVRRGSRGSAPGFEEDDLRMVVAMCVLGPGSASDVIRRQDDTDDATVLETPIYYGTLSIPPAAMRDELLAILRQSVPDQRNRLDRVMEFVIAYGCGKRRAVQQGIYHWEMRWQGAIGALARVMIGAVRQANTWLKNHVVGYPEGRSDAELWSDTRMLAQRLVQPERLYRLESGTKPGTMHVCADDDTRIEVPAGNYEDSIPPGAKAVWTIASRDAAFALHLPGKPPVILSEGTKIIIVAHEDNTHIEITTAMGVKHLQLPIGETAHVKMPHGASLAIWECTCGTTHCQERHRLEAWDPNKVSLWSFVASAVKGPLPIRTGSLVQGMYFALLTKEGF